MTASPVLDRRTDRPTFPEKITMADIDYDALLADPRSEVGSIPVGATGGGEDLRGGAEFEQLETEFRKIETAGPAAVDWKTVNRTTIDLLKSRSKDLVLASRLVYGLHREEGYKGLAVGITILHGMVQNHWETMFPPPARERGRAGSFDWLAEKLAPSIESTAPTDDKKVFALIAHDRLTDLDTMLGEKMTKFPPALGPLIRALRPHSREARQALEAAAKAAEAPAPEPAPAPAAAPAAPTQPEPAPAPVAVAPPPATLAAPSPQAPSGPVPELVLGDDTQKAFQSLFNAALRLAGTARQQAPADARAYRAARFAIWSPITTAPPDKGGKTALPPPPKTRFTEIQALRAASNHQGLLLSAESAFASSPFWLDAQHIAFQAMSALGPEYEQAKLALTGELAAFLKKMPSLPSLAFNDGTPFAEAETQSWIANEVTIGKGGGGDESDSSLGAAVKLAQAGQMLAGLKLLTEHADSRRGERERFVARLDVGDFCLRFELLQPLIALVDGLAAVVEQQSLERWEPKLAARLAGLTWRAVTHQNAKRFIAEADILARKGRILGQLAQLDIVMAAEFVQP
jgi:type VI secretion system protein VasJ